MVRQKRQKSIRTNAAPSIETAGLRSSLPVYAMELDRIEKMAELISNGEMLISEIGSAEERNQVLPAVARMRHRRLIQHIARIIALDIARSREPELGEHCALEATD